MEQALGFDIPARFRLNGVDVFMFQLDRLFRARSGRGNICVLALELDRQVEGQQILDWFRRHPYWCWVHSLRITGFVDLYWSVSANSSDPIEESTVDDLPGLQRLVQLWDLDPRAESPFQVRLVHLHTKSYVLFAWHHALMDAHGGELFCLSLAQGGADQDLAKLLPRLLQKRDSLRERLQAAQRAKQYFFAQAEQPMASLYSPPEAHRLHWRFTRRDFSLEETNRLEENCARLQAQFFKSCFFLAASVRAFHAVFSKRHAASYPYVVPVPHDERRQQAKGPAFGNQMSFLFYRLNAGGLKETTHLILDQAQTIISQGQHRNCRVFFDFIRRLPAPMYLPLVLQPSGGRLASFFFSDTGNSLARFTRVAQFPVVDAMHYPPHFLPPGLTVHFSQRAQGARVTLIHQGVADTEVDSFMGHLQEDLLGGKVESY